VSSVWIVSGSEYDDHGPVAAFTTRELADAYAAPKHLTVDEFTIHDRIPNLVKLHLQAATVLPDGTVQRGGCHSQEFWDSEAPAPLLLVRSWRDTQVIVWREDRATAEQGCLEEVKVLLAEITEEQQRTAEWLIAVVENARQVISPPAYVPPRQVCFDASFGRVHVKPTCSCGRRTS